MNQIEIFPSLNIDMLNSNNAFLSKETIHQVKEPDFPGIICSDLNVEFFPEVLQKFNCY